MKLPTLITRNQMWALLAICIVTVTALLVSLTLPKGKATIQIPAPVGAVLYLWYGSANTTMSGLGSPGWNSTSTPGGGAVVDEPVLGYYSSDNASTFAWQIKEMQSAGLSFAIVSWWGPYAMGESAAINNATLHLFQYLKETDSSFKIAIMADAYLQPSQQNNTAYQSIYDYVYDSFVGPFNQWYFSWNGKPLLLFFNPMYPTYSNSSYTIRTIGNRPNQVEWSFWDAQAQYLTSEAGSGVNASNDIGNPVISTDGEVTIVPRIDSYYNYEFGYQGGYMRFDPSLTQGLYQAQLNYVLSESSSVRLVIIYSWNE